jgi:2-octaprenylphenol hydroxylase
MQMQNVDVVIVGGGMVGLGPPRRKCAQGRHRRRPAARAALDETPDNRVSALSLASQHILQGSAPGTA